MNVINQPNLDYLNVLGRNRIRKGQNRRLLKFCAIYESDAGIAIYNAMTRSLVVMTEEEFESIFTDAETEYVDFLIRSYTLVTEDFKDIETMQRLRKYYEVPLDDKYLQKGNYLIY